MPQRSRMSWLALLSAAAATAALSVAGPTAASAGPAPGSGSGSADTSRPAAVPLDQLTVTTTLVASGLQRPTAIAPAGDGSGRLFVTEKPGRVRAYHPSTGLAATPVLDITDRVDNSGNERGLLGIATSPRFATDHALYAAYTALPSSAVTLSRFILGGSTVREEVLLTQEHATYDNHNGGQLAFGADGYLYWAIGDGGGAGDPFDSGQNLNTLLGKILRLDVQRRCGGRGYCVPSDNPFVGNAKARPEIWTYGVRNPWRFSFDAKDGSLWIADVGQGAYEEVDHLSRTQGGANLGWSCREGPAQFDANQCFSGSRYVEPVFAYQTSVDGCAVVGGFVYRGARFADLAGGTYVATDYCSNTAWAVRANADGTHQSARIGEFPIQPTTFGVDAAGELYLANDLPGQLYAVSFAKR
ncbi:PQQ-dependent sugar dehydrogenase [Goodfellowiella coeruleoviolacea]|uniref:Glucose/arabinose dehydrogenase, beta-propeller fold n=1 Tax=Goodfellowiella coeruleoviolacea TaxID=334858 RepID=A0AAE3GLT0_9PSEU|nr:PQQ-dependent sugar dehydrogenase [Goodfellowiella coeruleoviolacea]MCP2170380.1 Glucose/arabinose dehydrogenase, beta-propeller fold [Goodfellowiella coeruleoviolacea]